MSRTVLIDGWMLELLSGTIPAGRVIPASVPGCVHTDLLAQQLIPDPYLDLDSSGCSGSPRPTCSTGRGSRS